MASAQASLTALANHTSSLLGSANPVLVPFPRLDAIESTIGPSLTYVKNFAQDEDPDVLLRAWSSASAILASVSDLPVVKARRDTKGLADAIAGFEQHLTDRVERVAEHAEQVRATLDELHQELEKRLATAKSLVEMIGEVTMTGHYQRNAIDQKKAADKWRLATVAAGSLAIISAIVVVVLGPSTRTIFNGSTM